MKKLMLILFVVVFCGVTQAAFVLQDNFEGSALDTNIKNHTASNGNAWLQIYPPHLTKTNAKIDADPAGGSNQVYRMSNIGSNTGWVNEYTSIIATGTSATLFHRMRFDAKDAAPLWKKSFGASEEGHLPYYQDEVNNIKYPAANKRYNTGVQIITDAGTQTPTASAEFYGNDTDVSAGTWYNVWQVIDMTTETYEVYMNTVAGADTSDPST